jgi:hypothetical protein
VIVSAIALLPLVWRGCKATAREQIYLLLLEPAAKNTFSKQDAQILPYFFSPISFIAFQTFFRNHSFGWWSEITASGGVFTNFVHWFPNFLSNSQLRVVAQPRSRKSKIQAIAWKSFRRRLAAVGEGETVYLLRATQKDLKKEKNQVVPWVWLKD